MAVRHLQQLRCAYHGSMGQALVQQLTALQGFCGMLHVACSPAQGCSAAVRAYASQAAQSQLARTAMQQVQIHCSQHYQVGHAIQAGLVAGPLGQLLPQKVAVRGYADQTDVVGMITDEVLTDEQIEEAVGTVLVRCNYLLAERQIEDAESLIFKTGRNLNYVLPPESTERGALMYFLAIIYQFQHRYKQCENLMRSCFDLAELHFGEESVVAAICHVVKAGNLCHQGRVGEAEESIQIALRILQRVYGMDHECVGQAMFYGGLVLVNRAADAQDINKADKLLRSAVQHLSLYYGESSYHLEFALGCYNTLVISSLRKKEDLAEVKFQHLVDFYEDKLPEAVEFSNLLLTASEIQYGDGELDKALTLCRSSWDIIIQNYAENEVPAMLRYLRIGLCLAMSKQYEDADMMLQLAMEYFEELADQPYYIAAEAQFGYHYVKYMLLEEGSSALDKERHRGKMSQAIGIMMKGLGQEHPIVKRSQLALEEAIGEEGAIPLFGHQ